MRHSDSLDKLVSIYLASVCDVPFRFGEKMFYPKELVVSPLLLRGHTCPAGCGACCGSFSLDYLPKELRPHPAEPRFITINGKSVEVFSDRQRDVDDRWCRHLNRNSGRCGVYEIRPLACDFELIRFLVYQDKILLIQKQYGRAWAMERLDGERGALCKMLPRNESIVSEVKRKLARLEQWAHYFQVPTRIEKILNWIDAGDCDTALRLNLR